MPFTTVAPLEVTPHTIVAGKERYLGFNVLELLTGLISEVVFVGVNFRSELQVKSDRLHKLLVGGDDNYENEYLMEILYLGEY